MSAVAVLGASGGVGRRIVGRLLDRGHEVIAQTRSADRLSDLRGRARIAVFAPDGAEGYPGFLEGAEAAVMAIGTRRLGPTRLFSQTTGHLLQAMAARGVRRLVAITGVGAGETRGHGGFVYDRIVFPLFTARMYADKARQEEMIAASGLDWTLLRPAPFAKDAPDTPFRVITDYPTQATLTAITRDEVADFVVEELETGRCIGKRPFIGHE